MNIKEFKKELLRIVNNSKRAREMYLGNITSNVMALTIEENGKYIAKQQEYDRNETNRSVEEVITLTKLLNEKRSEKLC